jgi:hypothetical protein
MLKTEGATCPLCRKNVSKNVLQDYKYNVKETLYELEKDLVKSTITVIIKEDKFRSLVEDESNELNGLNYWMSNGRRMTPRIIKNGKVNIEYVLDISPYLENGKLKKRWVKNVFIPICHVMIKNIDLTYDSASKYKSKNTKDFVNTLIKYYKYVLELSYVSGFITRIEQEDIKVNLYLIEYILHVLGERNTNERHVESKFDREIVKVHDKMRRERYNYWVNNRLKNKRKGLYYVEGL